jgi:hypothetical protein
MQTFVLALIVALQVPGPVAEPVVHMPLVGFRYTTQADTESRSTSGTDFKIHSVLQHEVVASDGTTLRTRSQGTVSGLSGELQISGITTYRVFLLVDTESTARAVSGQPQSPVTKGMTWDCPVEGLDRFYPRGEMPRLSLACSVTGKVGGRALGRIPVTVSFSDLGDAQVATAAGEFDVRKLMVRTSSAEMTNEITYSFAPDLGISVMQDAKVSRPDAQTVTHSEVSEFSPEQ